MRPFISRLTTVKLGLLFAAWTVYGVLCAWQSHYWHAITNMPMSWADCLRYQLTYAYAWAAFTPVILWTANRFRFERTNWPVNVLIHLVTMTLLVAVTKIVFDLFSARPESPFRDFTWEKFFHSIESTFDTGPLLYALVVLFEHALVYYQRYQSGLVKAARLQTELIQAQLHALKMQLHPHFLFNTLHTVAALVHEDPDMAERTIARLGELLRLFLANSTIHEVTLSEELRVLDLYLEIERARFEERLQVRYDVPDTLRAAMVPSLVLQPLVENSIRHGIGRRAEPGWISVAAESIGGTLVLRVSDNGTGLDEEATRSLRRGAGQGMGLTITRGRLESLYGPQQSLVLRNLPAGGVEARITVPLRLRQISNQEKDHVELQSADC